MENTIERVEAMISRLKGRSSYWDPFDDEIKLLEQYLHHLKTTEMLFVEDGCTSCPFQFTDDDWRSINCKIDDAGRDTCGCGQFPVWCPLKTKQVLVAFCDTGLVGGK